MTPLSELELSYLEIEGNPAPDDYCVKNIERIRHAAAAEIRELRQQLAEAQQIAAERAGADPGTERRAAEAEEDAGRLANAITIARARAVQDDERPYINEEIPRENWSESFTVDMDLVDRAIAQHTERIAGKPQEEKCPRCEGAGRYALCGGSGLMSDAVREPSRLDEATLREVAKRLRQLATEHLAPTNFMLKALHDASALVESMIGKPLIAEKQT